MIEFMSHRLEIQLFHVQLAINLKTNIAVNFFIYSSLCLPIPYFCLFQFTFPKEAAKADDPASVSQILSGSHPVEQEK